jgi:prolyl 4-hydroxylase
MLLCSGLTSYVFSGDMVLYESHSVIHGRPFPLKGRSYANVFAHFEPIGPLDPDEPGTYDPTHDLPPYLIPGSKWEKNWRKNNPMGWKGVSAVDLYGECVCFSVL